MWKVNMCWNKMALQIIFRAQTTDRMAVWVQFLLSVDAVLILCSSYILGAGGVIHSTNQSLDCESLKPGQYMCLDPEIDNETQQAVGCTREIPSVKVPCFPAPGIYCSGEMHDGLTLGFYKDVPCKWTNGKRFDVALLLSVFLGWLGIDRFYLGYPALGLVKLCTFGFMLLWHLADILLIAIQVVGPSDGSHYVMDYYGAGLLHVEEDNWTYVRPPVYNS